MRSRASYKGHPIHTALIPFPFAFITGSVVFDVLGWLFSARWLAITSVHVAILGVITALIAAVPGFIDYVYTVPPRSTGKQRATRHMLFNLTAVALLTVTLFLRLQHADTPPSFLIIPIELVAVVLIVMAGWMGGTLVTRNQISIDHRYAEAGKWREITVEGGSGSSVVVARADELKVNQMKLIRAADRRIVLARTEDGYVAFDDRCTHRGGSLAGGTMACAIVQCPWHGSQFDVRNGAVKAGPAKEGIAVYRVSEAAGEVRLTL